MAQNWTGLPTLLDSPCKCWQQLWESKVLSSIMQIEDYIHSTDSYQSTSIHAAPTTTPLSYRPYRLSHNRAGWSSTHWYFRGARCPWLSTSKNGRGSRCSEPLANILQQSGIPNVEIEYIMSNFNAEGSKPIMCIWSFFVLCRASIPIPLQWSVPTPLSMLEKRKGRGHLIAFCRYREDTIRAVNHPLRYDRMNSYAATKAYLNFAQPIQGISIYIGLRVDIY